jgi:protein ImuB
MRKDGSPISPRTLVVWCPDWPVTAVGMDSGTPGAVAVADRVVACSAAARAAGVRRGQRVRDAQRRCPELFVADRDEDAEGRLFETVATAVTALAPRIEVVRPGVCALPVRGPARFYGGEQSLRTLVAKAVTATGFDCGVGIADGLFTAELAARVGADATGPTGRADRPGGDGQDGGRRDRGGRDHGGRNRGGREGGRRDGGGPAGDGSDRDGCRRDGSGGRVDDGIRAGGCAESSPTGGGRTGRAGAARPPVPHTRVGGVVVPPGRSAKFLAPYPLAVLDRPDLTDLLRRLGIRTLGQFAALPAGRVAERFGADGTLAHRLARGAEPRPPAPRQTPPDLAVRVEFDPAAERADEVIFAAKRLAGRLHHDLAVRSLTCARLVATVRFDDGAVLERLWRHDGRLSDLAVAERVRWQLSSWRPRPAEEGLSGGGAVALDLVPDQLGPHVGRQPTLYGRMSGDDRLDRAADRIQTMLGHQAITRPVLTGGRGPADRVIRVPIGDIPLGVPADGPWPGSVPAPAPSVVPPQPPAVAVTDAAGRPVTVDARCGLSAPPARIAVTGQPEADVIAWTGPWPENERWWDPDRARRRARFQVIAAGGRAYLLALEKGRWHAEAIYD